MRVLALGLLLGLAACSDGITPDSNAPPTVQVSTDKFSGAKVVSQDTVAAFSNQNEALNLLGFEWSAKYPDTVVITVQVQGVDNINAVAFNADGQVLDGFEPTMPLTNYGAILSTRSFVMTLEQFKVIASAQNVKMRVDSDSESEVSSFGPANGTAQVNITFAPFLAAIGG